MTSQDQEIDLTGVTPPDVQDAGDVIDLDDVKPPVADGILAAYHDTINIAPDDAAKVISLSKQLGEIEPFVAQNLQQAEKMAAAPTRSYAEEYARLNPKAAQFLEERRNAAIAKDDWESLGAFENFVDQISAGWKSGGVSAKQAELTWPQILHSLETNERPQFFEGDILALEKESAAIQEKYKGKPWYSPFEASQMISQLRLPLQQGIIRAGQGSMTGAMTAAVFGQAGPQIATPEEIVTVPTGAALGATVGGKLGAAEGIAMLEASESYRNFIKLKDKDGRPIEPRNAAAAAIAVGAVNAGLEYASLSALAKVFPPLRKVVDSFSKSPELFKNATKGGAIKEAMKAWLVSGATEAGTEVLQQTTQIAAREGLKADLGLEGASASEMATEAVSVIPPTLQAILYTGGLGAASRLAVDFHGIKKAEMGKQVYLAMGKTAEASKTRERLPEAYRHFVDSVTKDSAVEKIFISLQAFETYFQSKNIDVMAAAAELGIEEQVRQAREMEGGDVSVPLSTWVEKVVGSEHYNGLADDVKFSPDDLTAREAREYNAEIERQVSDLADQAEGAIEKDAALKTGRDLVYQQVLQDRLLAKPREMTPKEEKEWVKQLEAEAAIVADHVVVTAVKRKTSVEDLWKANRPDIVTETRPYRRSVMERIRAEIEAGEHTSGGIVNTDEAGTLVAGEESQKFLPSTSTFPEYFKSKGYTKKQTLKAIDKYQTGKDLTEREQQIIDDLYKTSGYAAAPVAETADAAFLQVPAYHGTPHDFDKFELNKIGTGEGAQAYGWGLYFASSENIAEWYRSNLAEKNTVEYDGKAMTRQEFIDAVKADLVALDPEHGEHAAKNFDYFMYSSTVGDAAAQAARSADLNEAAKEKLYDVIRGFGELNRVQKKAFVASLPKGMRTYNSMTPQEQMGLTELNGRLAWLSPEGLSPKDALAHVRKELQEGAEHNLDVLEHPEKYGPGDKTYARLRGSDMLAALEVIDKYGVTVEVKKPKGQLFRVMLAPDEADFLDFDKPISEQSEKVRAALLPAMKALMVPTGTDEAGTGTGYTGGQVYSELVRHFEQLWDGKPGNPAEAASKHLLSIGIPGIRYLDGSSRGRGEGAHNYVIFDDSLVKIEEKLYQKRIKAAEAKPVQVRDGSPTDIKIATTSAEELEAAKTQASAAAHMAKHFQGKTYKNDYTGWEIDVSDLAVSELVKGKPREAVNLAAVKLDELLQNAVYFGMEDNSKQKDKDEVKGYHVFYAPLLANGKRYTVRLKVRETNHGKKFYHEVAVETERPAGHDGGQSGKDQSSAFNGSSTINIDQFVAELNETGKRYSFLQADEDQPLGMVQLTDGAKIITLFKGSNASTFLHEMSHIWLNDAFEHVKANEASLSEQEVKDWLALAEWLKISPDQTRLTTEQQETFARSFEAYLREGKAPSRGLRRVFRKLRLWLNEIYRAVRLTGDQKAKQEAGWIVAPELGVEVSPEIRAVMDRMLATEEEIAAAQASVGYQPAIANLEGLPKEVAEKIKALQEEAHEEAVSILLKKQMDELKEERKEFLDQRRAQIEAEVKAEVEALPIYRVMVELRAQLGAKKTAKTLAEEYGKGKMKEGLAAKFEALAALRGYSSGSELAHAIAAVAPIEEEIAAGVRARMAEYADLKDTAKIKEEALAAIHNEMALELMAAEQSALESLIKGAAQNEVEKARRAKKAKIEAGAAKSKARQILSAKTIKEAIAFLPFFTGERTAAVRVAKALASKDFEAAAAYKRQQMINHALATEAMRLQKIVEKWQAYLADLQTKRKDLFKREEHFHQVAEILARLGLARRDYDKTLRTETLAQWAARMQEVTNTVAIPDWLLDESRIRPVGEMSVAELQDVVNTLKNIMTVANFEKRAFALANGASLDEISHDLVASLTANIPQAERDKNKPEMEPGKFDQVKRFVAKYLLSITKVQNLLRRADGWKDFGKMFSIFYSPIYKAGNEESKMMQSAVDGLEALWKAYSAKERAEMTEKLVYYPELGTSATKMRLIMMALNLGNADNKTKLFQNRPVGVEDAVNWDEFTVMALLQKHLDARDWNFVQEHWRLINSYWPELSKMHKDLTGFAPEKVVAVPFNVTLASGEVIALEGGYFPLKEDPRASVRAEVREQLDSPLYTEKNPGWMATTKTGHTKARTGAQYSVSLDYSLVYRHLRDVIHDITFRPTIIDLRRLLANEPLQIAIRQNLGVESYALLREWVGAVAAGNTTERQAGEIWERIVGGLRRRATVAALFMKPSVILQNLANPLLFSGAIEGFGKREAFHAFFVRGVLNYLPKALGNWKAQEEIRQFVYSKSRFMRDKRTNPDFSLVDLHNKVAGKDSKIQAFATALMAGSDELTAIPMWLEAYNLKIDQGASEEDAVKYADTLIDRTLGSGRKYDVAQIQRSGELAKSLSMFYTFLNTEFNRWQAEVGAANLDEGSKARLLGFMASRLLFFVTASAILSGKAPDDDEDPMAFWLKQTLQYPFSLFPGVREMSSVALDGVMGHRSFGYKPSPAVAAIEASLLAVETGSKAARGEAEFEEFLQATSKAASFLSPYPDQFNAWFWNAYDYAANGMSPEIGDVYRRRPKSER